MTMKNNNDQQCSSASLTIPQF